ncbi:unnamed protein product, partial [Larinioides sclopetarius]
MKRFLVHSECTYKVVVKVFNYICTTNSLSAQPTKIKFQVWLFESMNSGFKKLNLSQVTVKEFQSF